ncbi:nipped-B-like protein B isoform X7 [Brienomyrus brachyistius]|uniref:nipped-B-like protein B isoform X7 n=1 Tax=Brienomyrus brachyistius TaxID=42636 RepID=UPI0020B24E6A|nr:nipped-B-like protein B isoform X7 [Brienomyrus brachyistius]
MEDLSIDQTKLPGVKEVCRDFAVLQDHSLAHSLQEQEIENHLASNIHKSRLVQQDLQVARRLQEEEDLRAKAHNQKRHQELERSDNEIAQEIQEQLVRQAELQRQQEKSDAAIARKLQEKEMKEERRRQKQLEANFKEEYYDEKGASQLPSDTRKGKRSEWDSSEWNEHAEHCPPEITRGRHLKCNLSDCDQGKHCDQGHVRHIKGKHSFDSNPIRLHKPELSGYRREETHHGYNWLMDTREEHSSFTGASGELSDSQDSLELEMMVRRKERPAELSTSPWPHERDKRRKRERNREGWGGQKWEKEANWDRDRIECEGKHGRERGRDEVWEKDRNRERDRNGELVGDREPDRDRGWERNKDRNSVWESERERSRECERDKDRGGEWERDRDRKRKRDRDKSREGDKGKDWEMERGGHGEREAGRDRQWERDQDEEQEGDRNRERGKDRDGDKSREAEKAGDNERGREWRSDKDRVGEQDGDRNGDRDRKVRHMEGDRDRDKMRNRSMEGERDTDKMRNRSMEGEGDTDKMRNRSMEGERDRDTMRNRSMEGERGRDKMRNRSMEGERDTDKMRNRSMEGKRDTDKMRNRSMEGERDTDKKRNMSMEGERDTDKMRNRSMEGERDRDTMRNRSMEGERGRDEMRNRSMEGERDTDKVRHRKREGMRDRNRNKDQDGVSHKNSCNGRDLDGEGPTLSQIWLEEKFADQERELGRRRVISWDDEFLYNSCSRNERRGERRNHWDPREEVPRARSCSHEDTSQSFSPRGPGRMAHGEHGMRDVVQGVGRMDIREQELRDLEVARKLQEEELKASEIDKRAAQVAQDAEIARLLMEEEKRVYKKSKDREKPCTDHRRPEGDEKPGFEEVVRPRSREEHQQRSRNHKADRPPPRSHDYENTDSSYLYPAAHYPSRAAPEPETAYKVPFWIHDKRMPAGTTETCK